MSALTNDAENRTLNWLTGQTGANTNAPVLPLVVALVTTLGDDATAGTEVTGGSYTRQPADFSVASNGQASNETLIRYDNMPDVGGSGVVGFEIYDDNGVRWWHAALTTPRTYTAGDAAEFPAGELVLSID